MQPRWQNKSYPEVFVNRENHIKSFDDAVDELLLSDRSSVLVYHGVGGQGKTRLSQHLGGLVKNKELKTYQRIRAATINLRDVSQSDDINIFLKLRKEFLRAGVKLEAFDVALAIIWENTREYKAVPDMKKSNWAGEVAESASSALPDAADEFAGMIPFGRVSKWGYDKLKIKWIFERHQYLHELLFDEKRKQKAPKEQETALPVIFARNLNSCLKDKPYLRYLLLLDEYECVFEEGLASRRWAENKLDNHVRTIISETNSLLAVIFSREELPWGASPLWKDDLENKQHELTGLKEKDARKWLSKEGIDDELIQNSMLDSSREKEEIDSYIYPLLLEINILHWRFLKEKGKEEIEPAMFVLSAPSLQDRKKDALERLFGDYHEDLQMVLQRLSVSTRFDRQAFNHIIDTFGIAVSHDKYDQIIELSLFTEHDDGYVSMHRGVADILFDTLNEERKLSSINTLLEHYSLRSKADSLRTFGDKHVIALIESVNLRRRLGPQDYIEWLDNNTEQLTLAARAIEGEHLWRSALEISLANFGEEHPDTATSYNNMASNLNEQGRYDEAETLFRKGLEIHQQVLGEEHPDTATSYNNMASNLNAQGRYEEAEPLCRRALEIRQRMLGEKHPDTADSYNNVAYNLNTQGRYEEAGPLFRKGFEIRQQVLGEEHPDTASSYNNVASNISSQGRYEEAEPLYRKAVYLIENTHGYDHPNSKTMRDNLDIFLKRTS